MARPASPQTSAEPRTGQDGNGNGHGTGNGNGAAKATTTGYRQLTPGEKRTWRGLTIERRFTRPGVDPYDTVEWESREAVITNEHGKAVFEQRDLEIPKSWSQLATQVVASKYFRGQLGTPERERSVKQMLDRVVNTMTEWGIKDGYFATDDDAEAFRDELKDILLKQRAAFNSPVWFNVGIDAHPQCSACQPYDALVSTPMGMIPIGRLVEDTAIGTEVYDANGVTRIVAVKSNGRKPVWRIRLANGNFVEATPDHVVKAVRERRTTPEWLRVDQLELGMRMHEHAHGSMVREREFALVGARDSSPETARSQSVEASPALELEIVAIEELGVDEVYDIQTESGEYLSNNVAVHNCFINSVEDTMESILGLAKTEGMLFKFGSGTGSNLSTLRSKHESLRGGGQASGPVSFMKGFDAFAGVIKSGGKTRRAAKMVILNADHPDVEEFIDCKLVEEKKAWALIDAGYDGNFNGGAAYESVFFQNSNNSVRVTDAFMDAVERDADWTTHAVKDGRVIDTFKARYLLNKMAEAAWVCGDPGIQYHDNVNNWNPVAATHTINASNPCSEYMHIDDSACNLASLNLMKFVRDDGEFDVEAFKHAVRIVFTAQEIIVDNASYPTPRIGENSRDFRPIGIGYANLGALLMNRGLAYDSEEGRAYSAAVTALMQAESALQSARIAGDQGGPFQGYAANREPYLQVMNMHREAAYRMDRQAVPVDLLDATLTAWDEVIALGEKFGFRNSQMSVLAPTGCLTGDSLVTTDRGLVRLRSLGNPDGEKWQELETKVATDDGPRQATKFFVNGAEPVVTVKTSRGYRIQGTTTHRIRVLDADGTWQWRRFADLRKDDRVPLMLGGMIGEPREVPLPPLAEAYWTSDHKTFVPRYLSADLAELIGYFMGDGSLHSRGLRFCVTAADTDVVDRLVSLGRQLFGLEAAVAARQGYTEVAFHSVRLALWWEACGFAKRAPNGEHRGKGYESHIPDAVLYTNNATCYRAFVRGLFEADGNTNFGYAYWATVSEQFSYDVQTLLLALGFVTTRKTDQPGPGHLGKNPVHYLRLLNANTAGRFLAEVGFISERKRETLAKTAFHHPQAAKHDLVPVSRAAIDRLAPENDSLRRNALQALMRTGLVSRSLAVQLAERAEDEELEQSLGYFYDTVASSELGEEQLTYDLSVPANVTYVANGFVSHNTIAFLMDCDTTGVEPDIALIKYKRLVGGGYLKIVNGTVPHALKRLGYTAKQSEEIVAYIDEHETIEGAPHLTAEHLDVFDCAFKPADGSRSIHYNGHLKMMAAVQPFISGAISKTVNMPEHSTAADIAQVYIDGWKLGLKAIAVYRDNSKRSQPLNTKKEGGDAAKTDAAAAPIAVPLKPYRRRLPDERASITHKFNVGGHEGYLTIGLYEDGTPGEIFLRMAKEGSTISGLMDSFATAISLALQYGVPLRDLVNKFSHLRFEPAGFTTNREIPMAKSLVDYIFRYMATKFLSRDEQDVVGIINRQMTLTEAAPASGEASAGTPSATGSATAAAAAPTPAQPRADKDQGRSAGDGESGGGGEAATRSDAAPGGAASGIEPAGSVAQAGKAIEASPASSASSRTGAEGAVKSSQPGATDSETDAADEPEPPTVAPGQTLLDGLKIVAQNGLAREKEREERLDAGQAPVIFDTADSPSCSECGSIMVRNGSCYKCINCGATSGCS